MIGIDREARRFHLTRDLLDASFLEGFLIFLSPAGLRQSTCLSLFGHSEGMLSLLMLPRMPDSSLMDLSNEFPGVLFFSKDLRLRS